MIIVIAIAGPLAAIVFALLWFRSERLRKSEREAIFSTLHDDIMQQVGEVRVCTHLLRSA